MFFSLAIEQIQYLANRNEIDSWKHQHFSAWHLFICSRPCCHLPLSVLFSLSALCPVPGLGSQLLWTSPEDSDPLCQWEVWVQTRDSVPMCASVLASETAGVSQQNVPSLIRDTCPPTPKHTHTKSLFTLYLFLPTLGQKTLRSCSHFTMRKAKRIIKKGAQPSDGVELLKWLLNHLHLDFLSCEKVKCSYGLKRRQLDFLLLAVQRILPGIA